MLIIEKINEGIKDAMRSKDAIRLSTFRMLKSKILAVDARALLPDLDVLKIIKTYSGSLHEALGYAETAKRAEAIDQLKAEIAIVQEFLPKILSLEETKAIVLLAIADSGAMTKKDLGLVMKAIMKLNNTVDGKLARDLAANELPE